MPWYVQYGTCGGVHVWCVSAWYADAPLHVVVTCGVCISCLRHEYVHLASST